MSTLKSSTSTLMDDLIFSRPSLVSEDSQEKSSVTRSQNKALSKRESGENTFSLKLSSLASITEHLRQVILK